MSHFFVLIKRSISLIASHSVRYVVLKVKNLLVLSKSFNGIREFPLVGSKYEDEVAFSIFHFQLISINLKFTHDSIFFKRYS